MNKAIWLSVMFLALPVVMYFLNPFGTATQDPRARVLGYAPYRIPSGAMRPTLQENDFILVSAVAYMNTQPGINEVVVFKWPKDLNINFVMRVVATGGDVVSMDEGIVVVNGEPIDQSYVNEANLIRTKQQNVASFTVPENQLFVLGDNRDNSNDSRYWGFVPVDDVVGKVEIIWKSEDWNRIGAVE